MVNSDILIFDRHLYRQRLKRALPSFNDHNFLHQHCARALEDRLGDIKRSYDLALHCGLITPAHNNIKHAISMSPADTEKSSIIGEEEFLPLRPQAFDLITSNLELHTINDLPGALLQIKNVLKPDGLFLGAMLGGETLIELRESLMQAELEIKGGVSPRVHPFADKQQMGALMQRAGYALPVIDSDIIHVTYDHIFALMHDLRAMGQSNIIIDRDKAPPGKNFFMRAGQCYAEKFSDKNGRITARFEIIFLIGWAPHDSQQKPLNPGSAQTRLADALKTKEEKL